MQEEGFRTLEQGGALITASRRLSRALTAEFHERQRSLGRSVWPRPDILPFEAFVDRAWTNLVWQGAEPPGFTLLSPLEEQTVWERVIRDSPAGDSLLDVPDTARGVMEAWRLAHAYDVPVDGRFHATDDASAFLGWARDFESLCGAHLWLDRSRAIDFLAARYAAGDIARPASVYIAGFDDITPQQERFLRTLGDLQRIEAPSHEAEIERRKLVSSDDDIHAAAAWARATLERSPHKRIGVIVPDLRKLRPKVERIFREVLDPVCELEYGRRAYHVSLGPALDQYPLIYSAFLILEWAEGPLTVPRIGVLLRSPFLAGASQERSSRALLDVKLRKDGAWELDVEQLERSAGSCPELARHLARYRALTRSLPKLQRPSAWSGDFSNLLGALGWPGDRALDSSEHQVSGAWQKLLSDFATLDRTTPPQTLNQALSFLRRTAEATPFQQENTGAPIQVMGLLEASGLEFDCLWILGLDDRSMPAAASPNPFIPLALQRESRLPHCSPERELEYSEQLLRRLLRSAPTVVLSYPASEADLPLSPSPLVPGPWTEERRDASPVERWIENLAAAAHFEYRADDQALPLADDADQRGGVRLFQDIAACPFRAFGRHRLGASPLEDTNLGPSYRERGSAVHRALQSIWMELGSQEHLVSWSESRLRELVARSVREAVEGAPRGPGRKIEQQRLERLLEEWLEYEKRRAPFVVLAPEEARTAKIGGITIHVRVDRRDELADGRQIILDYKTGEVKPSGWDSERPDEPQIPLYCVTAGPEVAGAAVAKVRTGELSFRGLADGALFPEMKPMRLDPQLPFQEQVARWETSLKRLAEEFRAGRAEVDPKKDACEYCGLWAMCRIRESEHDRG